MLCSLNELGLTVHDFPYAIEDGIFIIEEDCEIGEDIHTAIGLNDISVEFEITSNRPDCLSVTGLAREAAATFNKPFQMCIRDRNLTFAVQVSYNGQPVGYIPVSYTHLDVYKRQALD